MRNGATVKKTAPFLSIIQQKGIIHILSSELSVGIIGAIAGICGAIIITIIILIVLCRRKTIKEEGDRDNIKDIIKKDDLAGVPENNQNNQGNEEPQKGNNTQQKTNENHDNSVDQINPKGNNNNIHFDENPQIEMTNKPNEEVERVKRNSVLSFMGGNGNWDQAEEEWENEESQNNDSKISANRRMKEQTFNDLVIYTLPDNKSVENESFDIIITEPNDNHSEDQREQKTRQSELRKLILSFKERNCRRKSAGSLNKISTVNTIEGSISSSFKASVKDQTPNEENRQNELNEPNENIQNNENIDDKGNLD